MTNIQKLLHLIQTEVKKGRKQPRDPVTGRYVAWDESAAAQHEHKDPEGYDVWSDPAIWGEPDPKLHKADEGISAFASALRNQVRGQIKESRQNVTSKMPANAKATNLYASYKHKPHSAPASIPKYIIHRIENFKQYQTPEGAKAADEDFLKRREQAMILSRVDSEDRARQMSIPELHASIAKAPHLVDQIMQHRDALHQHLRTRGHTKMMNGETHVALTRGLGAGGRVKDPMLTSYADTHEVKLGDRVKQFHNHWVPLKNVWYSYDHGPKEAHPNHYFPAQDEFLVSPHELKSAMTSDVKKLVPRKPKESKPQPVSTSPANQVPSSAPNVPGKLTASMSTNFFKLAKSFEVYGILLQKSGQYIKIAPEILAMAGGHRPEAKVRAQIKRQIGGRGKIAPADMATLLQNHDLYVTEALLERGDLTPEQIKTIAKSPKGYSTTSDHHGRKKIQEVNKATFDKLRAADGDGAMIQDLVNTGNDNAMKRLFDYAPQMVNGQHLFHLLTQRHDLNADTMRSVVRHNSWDNSHMSEITSHPNPEVIKMALNKAPADLDPAVMTRVLSDPRPEVRALGFKPGNYSSGTPVTPAQVMAGLNDADAKVREAASSRVTTPDMAREFVANHMSGPNNAPMVKQALNHINDPDNLRKITDFAIQHDPSIIRDLATKEDLPADSVNKILALPDNDTDMMTSLKRHIAERHSLTTEQLDLAIRNTNSEDIIRQVSSRSAATPEILRAAWQKMPKDSTRYNAYHGFAGNANTPSDVLTEMASNPHVVAQSPRYLIQHPNLAPSDLNIFANSEDPGIRQLAATNTNATSEQISKGIQDPNKDVRSTWLSHKNMAPGHFAVAMKDKSPKNRAKLMSHANATPEMIKHAIMKDKAEMVREAALHSPNATPELISHVALNDPSESMKLAAMKHKKAPESLVNTALETNPSVALAEMLKHRTDLTTPQVTKIYGVIQHAIDNLTPAEKNHVNSSSRYNSKFGQLEDLRTIYLNSPSSTPEIRADFVNRSTMSEIRRTLGEDDIYAITAPQLKSIYDRSVADGTQRREAWLAANPEVPGRLRRAPPVIGINEIDSFFMHPASAEAGLLQAAVNSPEETIRQKVATYAGLTPEMSAQLSTDASKDVRIILAENVATAPAVLQSMVHEAMGAGEEEDRRLATRLARNPNTPTNALTSLMEHPIPEVRQCVMKHPNTSEVIIERGLRDTDPYVKQAAGKAIAHHKPDVYNASLPEAHTVDVHPATEKLKHLKGKIEEMGGNVNKNQLPNKGQGLPGQIFDGKGNISGDTIDRYLKSLPHTNYNVSYSKWAGAQRHDRNVPQKVLQVNMTNDQIRQLHEQGLFNTFKKLHESSHYSGHPVDQHSLGWARIDDSHPGHWHIDEIQSDFGQGTIRQIEKLKDEGRASQVQQKFGIPIDTLTDHLKKIIKVFSGPFKNINHAIHAAVHQSAREKGIQSTSMDTLEDQAKQSGMRDVGVEGGKALPGHMINTYKQLPEDMGYEPKPKKDVMPNSQSAYGETEVQQRKLVKSVQYLKELIDRWNRL